MDILKKIEDKAQKAASLIHLDVTYISGVTEDLDLYKAENEALGVCCYGPSEEEATASARMEATAIFIGESTLADKFLASISKKKTKTK